MPSTSLEIPPPSLNLLHRLPRRTKIESFMALITFVEYRIFLIGFSAFDRKCMISNDILMRLSVHDGAASFIFARLRPLI